jgi:UDP-galactopyranose mutase
LNTDYKEVLDVVPFSTMIYTGPIDYYFDYCYGKLPYRSIEFKFETYETERFQRTGTVNYPNEHNYTRITEFKYLTGQQHPKTSVVYEFPKADGDPYYPVPRPENAELYKKYQKLAETSTNTLFTGRLATYKYYNMDQVVAQSLALFKKIAATQPDLHVNGKKERLLQA